MAYTANPCGAAITRKNYRVVTPPTAEEYQNWRHFVRNHAEELRTSPFQHEGVSEGQPGYIFDGHKFQGLEITAETLREKSPEVLRKIEESIGIPHVPSVSPIVYVEFEEIGFLGEHHSGDPSESFYAHVMINHERYYRAIYLNLAEFQSVFNHSKQEMFFNLSGTDKGL